MNSYDIKDVLLYSVCPLKYLYKKSNFSTKITEADERYIISCALKATYIKYFQAKGLGKPITVKNALSSFSSELFNLKRIWTENTSLVVGDTPNLLKAHSLIVDIEKFLSPTDELIAVNLELERFIKPFKVMDEADMIVFRHPPKKESYVEIVIFDENPKLTVPDFPILLRSNFLLSLVNRELLGEALTIKPIVYNILSGNKIELVFTREQRLTYHNLIRSIISGIESKSFYPRPSFGACEYCEYRSICSWKLNEKDKNF